MAEAFAGVGASGVSVDVGGAIGEADEDVDVGVGAEIGAEDGAEEGEFRDVPFAAEVGEEGG